MGPVRLDTSLEAILERHVNLVAPTVLATIVSTAGSTYLKAGARMLIEPDGRITGLLSGGCLENDLREHAYRVLAGGIGRAIEYDMRGDDDAVFGLGAGCEGAMRILLEPLQPNSGLAMSLRAAAAVVMSHHLPSDAAYLSALAQTDIEYVGVLGPKPRREKLLAELGELATAVAPRLRGRSAST